MASLLAGLDVGLAAIAAREATSLDALRLISLGVAVAAAGLWGVLDTWRRIDYRGRNWLYASLLAGVLAGVLRIVGRAIFVDDTGVSALDTALTGDAAFAALVVLVPAAIGVLLGGQLRPRGSTTRSGGDESGGSAESTDQRDAVNSAARA